VRAITYDVLYYIVIIVLTIKRKRDIGILILGAAMNVLVLQWCVWFYFIIIFLFSFFLCLNTLSGTLFIKGKIHSLTLKEISSWKLSLPLRRWRVISRNFPVIFKIFGKSFKIRRESKREGGAKRAHTRPKSLK